MGKNPVSVYVMSQNCNKTPFCMIYTVWKVFPGFLITFVLKRLLYVEFRVFWKEQKKGAKGAEDQDGLLPIFRSPYRHRMLVPCRNSGFSITTRVGLR